MNLNINKLITKSLPIIIVLLVSFFIGKIFYILLPKQSIEYTDNIDTSFEFKKYQFSNAFSNKKNIIKEIKPVKNEYMLNENIILQSIFQIGENEGFAIILEKGLSKTHTISKNEMFKGYRLNEIKSNFILFEKNDKIYKLFIKNHISDDKNVDVYKNEINKPDIIKRGDNSFEVNKTDVLSYSKNLRKVWNDIGLKTEKVEGKTIGFKIYKLAKQSVFGELGLKKGDVLLEANNLKLDNYQNAFKLYNQIGSTQLLKMTILREGKKMEIEYDIQ